VRPTSETIIWNTYKGWIQSYRDLPILVNQWANVVRWEMRTRLFLRTAEFLWQEGHTAHATQDEAIKEAEKMLDVYATFAEEWMAMPVVKGIKTPNERFAGALETYCIEALMQDGKALQAGTSHFLGQNFAKAFDVTFVTNEGKEEHVWATSWGVSTRLMGALIMTHSDDNGLVLPPKLAPIQVAMIPIYKDDAQLEALREKLQHLATALKAEGIKVVLDDDNKRKPGWKFAEYEMRGVPVRIAMGPRDLENNSLEIARRDTLSKEQVPFDGALAFIKELLEQIQKNLYNKALAHREAHTRKADTWAEFVEILDGEGGFVHAHWDGTAETEEEIKQRTKATIRCIPLGNKPENGKCILTGKPSTQRVLFARAY
jgi:prolyl-tRNA synthetase